MLTETKLTTAEELYELADSNFKFELIFGELLKMTPTNAFHGIYSSDLGFFLKAFVQRNRLKGKVFGAETGFKLKTNPDTVQAPDVAYVSEKKLRECPTKDWNKFLELSPDLVVEVLSPGNTVSEMLTKITNYFEAGTELLWVVDPKTKTVTVYESLKSIQVLTKEETLTGGKVLEGFELVLSELFDQEKF